MRTVKPLTNTQIKNATPKDKDYKLSDGNGLYIVIKKNNTKMWRFDFTYAKKRKSMSFGIYPDTSLKEAREQREYSRQLLNKNINPITEKRKEKREQSITLNKVVTEWIELRKKQVSEKTVIQNQRIFKNVTFYLGETPISQIKRADIIDCLIKVQNKGIIETAHRLLSLLYKLYKYATVKEYIEHNIISDIDKSVILIKSKTVNHPAITNKEELRELLRDIYESLPKFKTDYSTQMILKLVPYVFVRSANIRLMEWSEIDFEKCNWIISKEKMKTKQDFIFPLPTQAINILKEIKLFNNSKFVFPSLYDKNRTIVNGTLSTTLLKLGYKNRHTIHGFRSTFSTNANIYKNEHGYSSEIIECCLAHKEKNIVKASYDRVDKYKYLEEKRGLIQWYANFLDEVYTPIN